MHMVESLYSRIIYCILRGTFPTPLFQTQTHLIFEALYLTRFLMNRLDISCRVSHIQYLDAPTSMMLYFMILNFRFFMLSLPPCTTIEHAVYMI